MSTSIFMDTHRGYWYRKGYGENGRDLRRRPVHVSTDPWYSTRVSAPETHHRLEQLEDEVDLMCSRRKEAGYIIEDKDYDGFGPSTHSKYAMLRLMYKLFFVEFGEFAVLHVSYEDRSNTIASRLTWTNGHLFTKNKTAFILLNESHMMSMRWAANGEIVIRDTNVDTQLDGLWEFLYQSNIFKGNKIVLDQHTPQQGMGCGGCGAMSMVNALIPADCYATKADAEIIKLPYIEKIVSMMVINHCSPYDLASKDWRHASLGLIKRGDLQMGFSGVYTYDVDDYNRTEEYDNEAWSHFARFRLNKWLGSCMQSHNAVVQKIMRLYFQKLYEDGMNAAPYGADLDDMAVYTDFNDLVNLMERSWVQREAYYDRDDAIFPDDTDDVDTGYPGNDTNDDETNDEDTDVESGDGLLVRKETSFERNCRIRMATRYEKQSRTNSLSYYCTRIYKLPIESQLHFAMILGHAWTSRLKQEIIEHPYSGDTGHVPWLVVDRLRKDDNTYWYLNQELTRYEDELWHGRLRPRWNWGRYGLPQTSHYV